jgi:hypothetical protein
MVKQIEVSAKGIRQFSTQKGKHCCQDCSNCEQQDGVYRCKLMRGKNSMLDRRFPYDNTVCKAFSE